MREGAALIRSGLRSLLVNNFNTGNVVGLTSPPTFTQSVVRTTQEPYVYLRSESSLPSDINKAERPRDYITQIEVVTGFDTNEGGPRQRDEIVDEVVRILDRELPAISRFNVYISIVEDVNKLDLIHEENRVFFKGIVTVMTRAHEDADARANEPVATPDFVFSMNPFVYAPTLNRIELSDTGTITPATTYLNSNGFRFLSTAFRLTAGSTATTNPDGTISVGATDELSVIVDIVFENISDVTDVRTLTTTTSFPRIRSLRTGLVQSPPADVTVLSADIVFGVIAPAGREVVFGGTPGDRAYIAYADTEPALRTIIQQGLNHDIIDEFTVTTSNGYRIYTLDHPFLYTNTLTVNLT